MVLQGLILGGEGGLLFMVGFVGLLYDLEANVAGD